MLIKKQSYIPSSEITPKAAYLNRRNFLVAAGMAGAALSAGKLISGISSPLSAHAGTKLDFKKSDLSTHGEDLTPLKDITSYNNFYEFGTEKTDPYQNATKFKTYPWTVSVEGLVAKPQKFDVASIMKLAP